MEIVILPPKEIHWIKIPLDLLPSYLRDYRTLKGFNLISISLYGLFNNKVLLVYETSFMKD